MDRRRTATTEPHDPYDYVVYCSFDNDESLVANKLTFHKLCTTLRRYDSVDEYTVEYWNQLFDYFCIDGEHDKKFNSIEEVKENLTLEACANRLKN